MVTKTETQPRYERAGSWLAKARHPTKLVIVYPYKFTDVYYRRYEIAFLKQLCDVEVWDVGRFLYPRFVSLVAAAGSEDECVRAIAGWQDLFKAFRGLRKGGNRRVVVLQFATPDTVRGFICNLGLKLRADVVADFDNGGTPILEPVPSASDPAASRAGLSGKFIRLTRTVKAFMKSGEYGRLYHALRGALMAKAASAASLKPTHRVIAGEALERKSSPAAKAAGIEVVRGLSWDLSNSLAYRDSAPEPVIERPYALLLDGAGPAFASDNELVARRPFLTSERWYPALVAFFEQVERESGIKVVVAGHPKTRFSSHPKEFGYRPVIYGCTEELVKHAEFVIMRFSTAVSYAILYDKPAIMVHNDQMKAEADVIEAHRRYGDLIGVSPINIDAPPASVMEGLSLSKQAYAQYMRDYLTALEEPRPNYRIIADELLSA